MPRPAVSLHGLSARKKWLLKIQTMSFTVLDTAAYTNWAYKKKKRQRKGKKSKIDKY